MQLTMKSLLSVSVIFELLLPTASQAMVYVQTCGKIVIYASAEGKGLSGYNSGAADYSMKGWAISLDGSNRLLRARTAYARQKNNDLTIITINLSGGRKIEYQLRNGSLNASAKRSLSYLDSIGQQKSVTCSLWYPDFKN